jgi:DnaK suppressor protein
MDAALDAAHEEISSQLAEVESRELGNIENALERIRDGQYGACEMCELAIPMARLQALPYATLCINCQREAEKNGTSIGGSNQWGRGVPDLDGADNDVSFNDIEIDVS